MTDRMTFEPLTVHIGSQVQGVNLERDFSPGLADDLFVALMERGVLVFRDQHDLTPATHQALGEALGELNARHPLYETVAGFPDMMVIKNDADNPPESERWHTDMTFQPEPPLFSLLRAHHVPEVGGDTLWSDMRAAYAELPDRIKTLIAGLEAEHSMAHGFRYLYEPEYDKLAFRRARLEQGDITAVHPVVKPHPLTGEPMLFVNEAFTKRIVNLSEEESATILELLFRQVQRERYKLRLKWSPGTLGVWDNFRTQHYAVGDHWPA